MDAKDILGLRGAPAAAPAPRKAKEPALAKPKGISREARARTQSRKLLTLCARFVFAGLRSPAGAPLTDWRRAASPRTCPSTGVADNAGLQH